MVEENTLSSNTDVLQELEKWALIIKDANAEARYNAARLKRAG